MKAYFLKNLQVSKLTRKERVSVERPKGVYCKEAKVKPGKGFTHTQTQAKQMRVRRCHSQLLT